MSLLPTVSTCTSDHKRKRPPLASSSSSDSVISTATGNRLVEIYGTAACWHCGASPADAVHVITTRDYQFDAYKAAGLLNIDSLSDLQNAVSLCPLCRRNFHDHDNPGFVFFPADLDYFRAHEEHDAQRRREEHRLTGAPVARISPTAASYFRYQRDEGLIDENFVGGIHERYTLRDYFPTEPSFIGPGQRLGQVARPAPWHGDPMAALERAFAIPYSPSIPAVPLDKKKALMSLCLLYAETDATYQLQSPDAQRARQDEDTPGHGAKQLPNTGAPPSSKQAPSQPPNREETNGTSLEQTDLTSNERQNAPRRRISSARDHVLTPPFSPSRSNKREPTDPPPAHPAIIADTKPHSLTIATPRTGEGRCCTPSATTKRHGPTEDDKEAPSKRMKGTRASSAWSDLDTQAPEQGWRWGPTGTANGAIEFYKVLRACASGHCEHHHG